METPLPSTIIETSIFDYSQRQLFPCPFYVPHNNINVPGMHRQFLVILFTRRLPLLGPSEFADGLTLHMIVVWIRY